MPKESPAQLSVQHAARGYETKERKTERRGHSSCDDDDNNNNTLDVKKLTVTDRLEEKKRKRELGNFHFQGQTKPGLFRGSTFPTARRYYAYCNLTVRSCIVSCPLSD